MASNPEVLIVGAGPGGLSAALTLARLDHSVKIFDNNDSRNKDMPSMTMMITMDGATPSEFRRKALENLLSRHKKVSFEEADIKYTRKLDDGSFEVEDAQGRKWQGKKLVLATGCQDIFPNVKGYGDFWGKGM